MRMTWCCIAGLHGQTNRKVSRHPLISTGPGQRLERGGAGPTGAGPQQVDPAQAERSLLRRAGVVSGQGR